MRNLNVRLPDDLYDELNRFVAEEDLYVSKSEAVRDAIRNLMEESE